MKTYLVLLAICFLGLTTKGQERNYLLHTEANISRLKKLVRQDQEVKEAWESQLDRAKFLLKKERLGAADCQVLGLAYRMTGKEAYAIAIKKILLDYIGKTTWEGRGLLNRTPSWQGGLNTAHTTFYLTVGFDCAYAYLTPEERLKIAQGIARLGIRPQQNDWINPFTNFHTFDTMGHNWWSACVYMAGFAAIAIQNEIPEAKQWIAEIEATAYEWFNYSGSLLQNKIPSFDRDGAFWESINYASFGVSQYLLFRLGLANAMPGFEQTHLPVLEKIIEFFIQTTYYVSQGRPLSVNFGDSKTGKTGNACAVLLWNLGYQDDNTAWYLHKVNHGTDKEVLEVNTPIGLILCPELPEQNKGYLPQLGTSHLYQDIGWATMRDSWENDATFVAVKSGLTWNHSHADAGSYIVYHNGKYLIIDSGNSSYGNPLYTKYFCQSVAHNVVLFNGEGQNTKDPYFGSVHNGSLHNLIDAGDFKYLLANATGPYSHILDRNYRSFLWVGDVLLVIDDLLAREPGQFEWLLHYNGTSKRHELDLSVKDGDAEVLIRPLYPETFPNGGLPHDFPEKMRLEEKLGYAEHHPENRRAFWSVSHFEQTARTKFITAITFKDEENQDNLPQIEKFEGNDYLGVRITQKGQVTEVYLNLLADGRIKHRNSVIEMNGWQTDAYLMALTFKEGTDLTQPENLNRLFIGHGSYLRKNGNPMIHALSKFFTVVDFENMDMQFQGQENAKLTLYQQEKPRTWRVNGEEISFDYNPQNGFMQWRNLQNKETLKK